MPVLPAALAAALPSYEIGTFVDDGVWSWFTDPRAIYHNGNRRQLYVGFVRANGDVGVGSYDLDTRVKREFTLAPALEIDDHNLPSLWVDPNGRIHAFYQIHGDSITRIRTTNSPEDISSWEAERVGPLESGVSGVAYTYSNVYYLANEARLFFFGRSQDRRPHMSYSDDNGRTWSNMVTLLTSPGAGPFERPYVKYASNGTDTIHFWSTWGHPREYTPNHVVHFYYRDGAFYTSNGTEIAANLAALPILHTEATIVHNATTDGGDGWTWSLELDGDRPVATYTVFPPPDNGDVHHYRCAWWNGTTWQTSLVTAAGGPDLYPTGNTAEPQYSGGLVLDPADTNRIFLSRVINGQWEVESVVSADGKQTWTLERQYTSGSVAKNARPFAPRGRPNEIGPRVLWWNGTYTTFENYDTSIMCSPPLGVPTGAEPVNTLAPAITGTVAVGQTQTASTGTWTGANSFVFQWTRDGVPIVGATASTYVLQAADDLRNIACAVMAINAHGRSTAISNVINTFVPPETFLFEPFTGTAGALLQTLPGWTKHPSATQDAVLTDANRLRPVQASVAIYYNTVVPPSAEYDVVGVWRMTTFDTVPPSSAINNGICGRMSTTANTMYVGRYLQSSNRWELLKIVAGTATVLASSVMALTASTTYTLTLEIRNATKRLLLDGNVICTTTDNAITDAGRVGVRLSDVVSSDTVGLHLDSIQA